MSDPRGKVGERRGRYVTPKIGCERAGEIAAAPPKQVVVVAAQVAGSIAFEPDEARALVPADGALMGSTCCRRVESPVGWRAPSRSGRASASGDVRDPF